MNTVVFACPSYDDWIRGLEDDQELLEEYKKLGAPNEMMRKPEPPGGEGKS